MTTVRMSHEKLHSVLETQLTNKHSFLILEEIILMLRKKEE